MFQATLDNNKEHVRFNFDKANERLILSLLSRVIAEFSNKCYNKYILIIFNAFTYYPALDCFTAPRVKLYLRGQYSSLIAKVNNFVYSCFKVEH